MHTKSTQTGGFLTLLLGLASGCGDDLSSAGIATADIEMDLTVFADTGRTSVDVDLGRGPDTVTVGADETLTIQADDAEPTEMTTDRPGSYELNLTSDDIKEVVLAYNRTTETSAPSSRVSIPAKLALDPPLDGATISYAEGFSATILNAFPGQSLKLDPSMCDSVSLGGTITIPPGAQGFELSGSFFTSSAPAAGGTCVEIRVTSEAEEGAPDPAFHERSEVRAVRYETFTVNVVP